MKLSNSIKTSCCLSLGLSLFCPLQISAFDSPNGKFSLNTDKGNDIEFNIVTDNGKLPLIRLLAGEVKEIGSSEEIAIDYEMITGKSHHCENSLVEQKYLLNDGDRLSVRLYNDGFAWRLSRGICCNCP